LFPLFKGVRGIQSILFKHPLSELANTYRQRLILEHKSLSKKRLEKDMRIAAISLSVDGIIITRNQKDFSQVLGIKIEDWTL
jgi:tRNA(fMet)-specific endonuclease VapC